MAGERILTAITTKADLGAERTRDHVLPRSRRERGPALCSVDVTGRNDNC
jgi:hypothetical protein